MAFRFVTKTVHAYLDYPVAASLIIMPIVLGLGQANPIAFWLSVATGIAAFVLTFLTDHHLGLIRVLPYSFHLAVDFVVGLVFLAAPFAFGFSGLDAAYYLLNGAAVVAVIGLHKPEALPVAA